MERNHADGKTYSRAEAFHAALRSARYVRIAALGDPCVLPRREIEDTYTDALLEGFRGVLAYTHGWRDAGSHLRGLVMASCDTLAEADEAVDANWRATVILPWNAPHYGNETLAGREIVVCPAQTKAGVTCNVCGLCDARRAGPDVIGFLDHGPQARGAQQRLASGKP